jgi:hypothetical protein
MGIKPLTWGFGASISVRCAIVPSLELSALEEKLQRKLNVPGCADVSVPLSERRTCDVGVEGGRTEAPRLADKYVLVKGVEELSLEAHSYALRDGNVLDDADVRIRKSGTA